MKDGTRFITESLIQIAKTTSDDEFREQVLNIAYEKLMEEKPFTDAGLEDDMIAQFVERELIPYGETERALVYIKYMGWCEGHEVPVSRTRFYRTLKSFGIRSRRTSYGRFLGVTIKGNTPEVPSEV